MHITVILYILVLNYIFSIHVLQYYILNITYNTIDIFFMTSVVILVIVYICNPDIVYL